MGQDKEHNYDTNQKCGVRKSCQIIPICNMLGDGGFECTRDALVEMGMPLNVALRNQHVAEIERYIRTEKRKV